MGRLKFYEVDKSYISYLKQFESKIPNIAYDKHDKFICGILFEINGMNYYAPVSSFNKPQRTNFLLKDKDGKITSSIRFSFMFPVPNDKIKELDFSKEKGFYKYLLLEEVDYCNKHKEEIFDKAGFVYDRVVKGKDELMKKNCCDFEKLEYAYDQYMNQQAQLPAKQIEGASEQ